MLRVDQEDADLFSQVLYHAERPDGKLIVAKYHKANCQTENMHMAVVDNVSNAC